MIQLFKQIIEILYQIIDELYGRKEPSLMEVRVIEMLRSKPNMIQGCATNSTLYPLYKRLEERGLVERYEFMFRPTTSKCQAYEFYRLKQLVA